MHCRELVQRLDLVSIEYISGFGAKQERQTESLQK